MRLFLFAFTVFLASATPLCQLVGSEAARKLELYQTLLLEWNKKINLVSREIQAAELMEDHILPRLSDRHCQAIIDNYEINLEYL